MFVYILPPPLSIVLSVYMNTYCGVSVYLYLWLRCASALLVQVKQPPPDQWALKLEVAEVCPCCIDFGGATSS